MANAEHLRWLDGGAAEWNERNLSGERQPDGTWAPTADLSSADLSGRDLRAFDLYRVDLTNANLTKASLRGADLSFAVLRNANCRRCDFGRAYLFGTDLSDADLTGSSLAGAVCSITNFARTCLAETQLVSTVFSGSLFESTDVGDALAAHTVWADVDLRGLKNLEEMTHRLGSTLGIDTILKSEGNIPPVFLRGTRVPDTVIAYIASLEQLFSQRDSDSDSIG